MRPTNSTTLLPTTATTTLLSKNFVSPNLFSKFRPTTADENFKKFKKIFQNARTSTNSRYNSLKIASEFPKKDYENKKRCNFTSRFEKAHTKSAVNQFFKL